MEYRKVTINDVCLRPVTINMDPLKMDPSYSMDAVGAILEPDLIRDVFLLVYPF